MVSLLFSVLLISSTTPFKIHIPFFQVPRRLIECPERFCSPLSFSSLVNKHNEKENLQDGSRGILSGRVYRRSGEYACWC